MTTFIDSPYVSTAVEVRSVTVTRSLYGMRSQQRQIKIDLTQQVLLGKRLTRRRQQYDCEQVDRRYGCGGIDVPHDAAGEHVDRRVDPRQTRIVFLRLLAPLRIELLQDFG